MIGTKDGFGDAQGALTALERLIAPFLRLVERDEVLQHLTHTAVCGAIALLVDRQCAREARLRLPISRLLDVPVHAKLAIATDVFFLFF